ncbi:GyrI-like domain-containing protein [Roseateles amylovorans]|uniref:GyrI-like domain-containing protein n=1 Tax=Roseateles amylovorans TaxID=2978473 RepID=A0ABY6AXV4_9BURK|nr:GyrI-like domain-containing protein [Roseateles amylovorans]UXH77802.1 GyrI-like domain-containing protein [Roseateles amylovorans]
MLTLPQIIARPPQRYAFARFTVRMDEMQKPADEGFPVVLKALAEQGIPTIGAPFYNYRRINMAETLDVEAGIAVERHGAATERVDFGTLPAGRFVTLSWHGHPDKLEAATAMLIGWVRLTDQPLDVDERADGDHFACRLEFYVTDPDEQPDMTQWVTELAFKLKD